MYALVYRPFRSSYVPERRCPGQAPGIDDLCVVIRLETSVGFNSAERMAGVDDGGEEERGLPLGMIAMGAQASQAAVCSRHDVVRLQTPPR